jgi:hypothetical protein
MKINIGTFSSVERILNLSSGFGISQGKISQSDFQANYTDGLCFRIYLTAKGISKISKCKIQAHTLIIQKYAVWIGRKCQGIT